VGIFKLIWFPTRLGYSNADFLSRYFQLRGFLIYAFPLTEGFVGGGGGGGRGFGGGVFFWVGGGGGSGGNRFKIYPPLLVFKA